MRNPDTDSFAVFYENILKYPVKIFNLFYQIKNRQIKLISIHSTDPNCLLQQTAFYLLHRIKAIKCLMLPFIYTTGDACSLKWFAINEPINELNFQKKTQFLTCTQRLSSFDLWASFYFVYLHLEVLLNKACLCLWEPL